MDTHLKFLRMAIELANQALEVGQTPFGCVITQNNEIVSATHNSVWLDCDITAHAEINAIRHACKKIGTIDLSGCDLYSSCEPCPMCFSAIHWAKISRLYYSASIEDAKQAGFNELSISARHLKKLGGSQTQIEGGLIPSEGRASFERFKKFSNARLY
jgi:tRNA(Arg) A34 adenosine deaminase TadA